jgi:hypothetical protein
MTAETTSAVGGTRTIPAPDTIARDYLLLALRLDQRIPGLVDGYFGPADLKAQVDMEPRRAPERLVDDAVALREYIAGPSELLDHDRRRWLTAQLVALEASARTLTNQPPPYVELLERTFDVPSSRWSDDDFRAAASAIDDLLPGAGSTADRLEAWDARFAIATERLSPLVDGLVARFRARARELFGLPEGEQLHVGLVQDQPWAGYNWYEGGLRSRVDLNTDLPIGVPRLIDVISHETYPGHHLEHAWHEADLVNGRRRLECSVLLLNTPECLISEGLADVGHRFVMPPAEEADFLVELFEAAGLAIAADPAEAREAAERTVALSTHRLRLDGCSGEAAMRRHADGWSHDEVLAYLREVGLMAPDRAAKRLAFIEHPLWRTYIHIYAEGSTLLERWLTGAPPEAQPARFGRLLHEQLTPGAIFREITTGS